jgi:hypothetical protein
MRYVVSQRFYDLVNIMVEVALQNGNEVEYDIAFDLLRDLDTDE